jgi:hypothetical protein
MNPNRLARSHGFFDWKDLLSKAQEARRLRVELRAARELVLPTVRRAELVEKAQGELAAEKTRLASAWRELADLVWDKARAAERDRDALKAIAAHYHERAKALETGDTPKETTWTSD